MKITSVETIRLALPEGNAVSDAQHRFGQRAGVVVRVHTDAGLTGHGYIYLGVSIHAAQALQVLIERQLAPVLIGQDPFMTRLLRERMAHELEYVGIQGLVHFCLTALDACLWDLMARDLGVPGWRLLGACRDRIPAYAMVGWYYDDDQDLGKYRRAIETVVGDGFTGVKIKVAGGTLEDDVRRIELAQELVGSGGLVMVDANQMLDRNEALRRGLVYQQLGVHWFEEPLRPHDTEGYAWLCDQLTMPVATGENHYGRHAVQALLAARGCDILQPDARRTGGPSEWLEIAGLASAYHVAVASHGGEGVTTHLLMATPTAIWCETGGKPRGTSMYTDRARIEAGMIHAPEAVGFGTELTAETLERYGVKE
ncbi:MAG: mandelate racemase/muconate lactonizing enzyme family protein [Anaerolineae bacterium]|nr:mandelate racemase/muconate lactonizing enzyme family protein [Chloroflexota bacterium]